MTAPSVRQRPTTADNARRRRTARRGRLDVRIGERGLEAIDRRAHEDGVDRSEEARRLLAYACAHMPAGWHPAAPTPRGARS